MTKNKQHGFTLVELSIVLVIIGLLVGGVLVGKDLIKSSEIRSQVSQIEQYNTAVNTFKLKYGGIPGDLLNDKAQAFGLFAMPSGGGGASFGEGDGNGLLESYNDNSYDVGVVGEPLMFFRQLSDAKLITGDYGLKLNSSAIPASTSSVSYLPPTKIGNGATIQAHSPYDGKNYFLLTKMPSFKWGNNYIGASSNPLTAQEASSIDAKIDDGMPASGSVVAVDANDDFETATTWTTISANSGCVASSAYAVTQTTQSCSLRFQFK